MQKTEEDTTVVQIGLDGMMEEICAPSGRSLKIILKREPCSPEDQAETFKQAAETGTPFCEP